LTAAHAAAYNRNSLASPFSPSAVIQRSLVACASIAALSIDRSIGEKLAQSLDFTWFF